MEISCKECETQFIINEATLSPNLVYSSTRLKGQERKYDYIFKEKCVCGTDWSLKLEYTEYPYGKIDFSTYNLDNCRLITAPNFNKFLH